MVGVVADRVIVELEAKLDRYNANVLNSQRTFERAMQRTQASATRTEGVVTSSVRRMGGAFATYLSVGVLLAGARGFLGYVDAAKQLSAQLKLATQDTGNFATAQRDVRAIAAATRSDLNSVGNLYANIARNARDLGVTQQQVAQITTAVSQSFLISGASAVEAAQGTRQLIQGLQSGVLRGDEFNTVMESAPRLARLLAQSLGQPIGALRAMAEEGELTSATLVRALSDTKFTEGLDAEFKRLPVTFDQAMTLVSNAAQETFSAFDQGGQFSQALANFVTGGQDGFDDLAKSAEELGIDIAATFAGLHSAFEPLLDGALSVFGQIGSEADGLARAIADILGSIDAVANAVPQLANRIRQNGRNAGIGFMFGQDTALPSNLGGRFMQGYQSRKGALQVDARERAWQNTPLGNSEAFQRWMNEPDRYDITGNLRNPRAAPAIGKSGGKKKGGGRKGPSAETLAARAERARLQQEREDEAFRQDLAKLNEDILAAKTALVTAGEAIAAAEITQLESERQRTNAAYQAEVVQKRLTETQAAELIEANNRLSSLKIQAVHLREQERLRAAAVEIAQGDRQNALDLAQKAGELVETRTEQRDTALRILDLQYQIERAELENVVASREATEAQKEIARRRLAILGQLQAGDTAAVERQHRSPGETYRDGLNTVDVVEQQERALVDGLQAVENQLVDTTAKIFEMGGAFGKVANQIISDLVRIAIQQNIIKPLANLIFGGGGLGSLFGGFNGGIGGGTTAGLEGLYGGSILDLATPRATGGPVTRGRPYMVGERGRELFVPEVNGTIVPNAAVSAAGRGGGGRPGTVVVQVVAGEMFGARVTEVAGPVAARVVQAAAPRIAQVSAAYGAAKAGRPRM
jgi:tape measure domain-containing protein